MRFITDFEVDLNGSGTEAHSNLVAYYKGKYANHLGGCIADHFGWSKTEHRFKDEHKIEIEAFPMDKWVEFKELFMHQYRIAMSGGDPMVSLMQIGSKLSDLESFGTLEETKQ